MTKEDSIELQEIQVDSLPSNTQFIEQVESIRKLLNVFSEDVLTLEKLYKESLVKLDAKNHAKECQAFVDKLHKQIYKIRQALQVMERVVQKMQEKNVDGSDPYLRMYKAHVRR
jgi:signal transduction protein with GAF and PtsI domain